MIESRLRQGKMDLHLVLDPLSVVLSLVIEALEGLLEAFRWWVATQKGIIRSNPNHIIRIR